METRPKIGMIAQCAFTEMISQALLDAGSLPVLLPIQMDPALAADYVALVDGLLVPGGEDVTPFLYGQDPCDQVKLSLMDKDLVEIALIKAAIDQKKPIFAICRGQQIVNVALGGTLIQDILTQVEKPLCHRQSGDIKSEPLHRVTLDEGGWLQELFGVDYIDTNTLHHQSIGRMADGLKAVAHTADGIIEGIQSEDGLIFGVQFHPECMFTRFPQFLKPFRYLVDRARERMEGGADA